MKKTIVIALSLLLGISVIFYALALSDVINIEDYPNNDQFTVDSRLSTPQNFNALKLSIINTATAPSKRGLAIGGESIFADYTISHSAIFIEHAQGNMLFDTGLGSHIDEQFLEMPEFLQPILKYHFIEEAHSQLSDTNLDVDNIMLSHLHWDHAGGIEDFPDSQIWTTKQDLDVAMIRNEGSLKSQLDGKDINWNFIEYENQAYENFARSSDFYGDGSIVIVPLPGHTRGSLGIFVNLQSGKRYFLTGDATYGLLGFSKPAEKSFMLKYAIDYNHKELITTIVKVYYLMKKYPDLIIVPSHDAELQNTLPQFKR